MSDNRNKRKGDGRGRKRSLTEEDAENLRFLYKHSSCSVARCAAKFGVSEGTASNIILRTGAYAPHHSYERTRREYRARRQNDFLSRGGGE